MNWALPSRREIHPIHTRSTIDASSSPRAWTEAMVLWLGFGAALLFYGVGVNLTFLWCAIAAPVLVVLCASRVRWQHLRDEYPGLLLVVGGVLAYLTVHHWFISISRDSSFGASLIIAGPLLWLLALLNVQRPALVFRGMVWMVFGCALVSVVQFLHADQRPYAPLLDPNNYTTLVLLAWVPWLHTRLAGSAADTRTLILSALVSGVMVLTLLAGQSRFGMVMLMALGIYWVWMCWRQGWAPAHLVWVIGAAAVAVGVHALATPDASDGAQMAISTLAEAYRGLLYSAAWSGVLEHGGVWGAGLGSFVLLYPQLRHVAEQNTAGIYVHNDYLQLLFEGGVPLLLVLLVPAMWVLWRLVRATFGRAQPAHQHAALLALAIALVHALVNFVFFVLVLGVMAGVLLALSLRQLPDTENDGRHTENQGSRSELTILHLSRAFLAGASAVVLAYLLLDCYIYGVLSGQNAVPGVVQLRQDSLGFARAAGALNADRGVPLLAQAQLLERGLAGEGGAHSERRGQIDGLYRRAIQVDPWNPLAYSAYFHFLRSAGSAQPVTLQQLLDRALQLYPADVATTLVAVEYLDAIGAEDQADRHLAQALRWCGMLKKSQRGELVALARFTKQRVDAQGSLALRQSLEECRVTSEAILPTRRAPPLLLQWLK